MTKPTPRTLSKNLSAGTTGDPSLELHCSNSTSFIERAYLV
jgi:hypothetical protein